MSHKRTAAQRRKELREKRHRHVSEARRSYTDDAFGITVRELRTGLQVRWNVDQDPYLALMGLDRLRRGPLAGMELELVQELRSYGSSWDDIGRAVGVTGEALRRRLQRADAAGGPPRSDPADPGGG